MDLMLARRVLLTNLGTWLTVAGELVSFAVSHIARLKHLQIAIDPVQDLHGQASPYPSGGGKNLFDMSGPYLANKYVNNSGAIVDSAADVPTNLYTTYIPVSANTKYTISGLSSTATYIRIVYYNSSKSFLSRTVSTRAVNPTVTVTTPANTAYILINPDTSVSWIQVEKGSTVTFYAPFAETNICPFSGLTGATIFNPGKNLLRTNDTGYENCTYGPTGVKSVGDNRISTGFIRCGEGVAVTFSTNKQTTSTAIDFGFAGIAAFDKNKNFISRTYVNNQRTVTMTTPTGTKYIRAFEQISSTYATNPLTPAAFANRQQQLEIGDTATAYTATDNSTLAIDWTDGAGTIYGGSLDVVTGALSVDRIKFTIDDSTTLYAASGYNKTYSTDRYATRSGLKAGGASVSRKAICNRLSYALDYIWSSDNAKFFNTFTLNSNQIHINLENALVGIQSTDDSATRNTKINSWLEDNPLDFVLELASPQTYQLTPTQVSTLLGTNSIWADSGAIESVTYKA